MKQLLLATMCIVVAARNAHATAEICGNDIDDDGNGMVDEGCAPTLTTGVCESPLSCGTTGMVSWKTGALHYDLPSDVSPAVPYGPGVGLRRFYTSMYAPGTGPASVNHTPLGARWQHTYMSWIDKSGSGTGSKVILHTSEGRDVMATWSSNSGGWDNYLTTQAGFHVLSIKYNTASPNQYQVQLLTGETLYFNSVGQLTQIWDTLPTPNKVMITWTSTSGGNVSTVTDASGKRRLLFNYTSNLLTSVNYQLNVSGTWTTQHTTTYSYTSGTLMSATIGASLSQQYAYTGGYLSSITDATGNLIASFNYNSTTSGQVDAVTTPDGNVGFEFASTRTACSGNTVLYFNKEASGSCNVDSDCGTGFCGGKTGTGSTGQCFAATRCMTLGTVNGESVVTTVVPLSTPPAGTQCTGACADVAQYVWSSTANLLNVAGMQDPLGNYTSVAYDANGLPTQIAYADTDTNPTNGGYARTIYIHYDTTFPGRIAETRRQSESSGASACAPYPAATTYCAVDSYGFGSDNQLQTVTLTGTTLNNTNTPVGYTYLTTYTHDSLGRLSEIDGPVSGMKTTFDFFTSTDPKLDGFVQHTKNYKDVTNHLDTTILSYDFWGNAIARMDPDGTVSCRTFDSSRNYLSQTREAMAGQTDCTTSNGADIIIAWMRDSALRLTQYTRPDGSCVFDAYNTSGQLSTVKRRDDCNASSAGDYESYTYTTDGLVSEVDTYDSSGALKHKQPYTYYQSRRLQNTVNPVDSTYKQASYDARGVMTELDDEISGGAPLGKTIYSVNADHRMTTETRYKSGTGSDSWSFTYDWVGDQSNYTDGDSKSVQSVRDDLGRYVKMISPDRSYPTLKIYDAASRLIETNEAYGISGFDHTFTYDYLGRRLNDDYAGTCPTGTAQPEIQRTYDTMPSGITCPITGGCTNIGGRLAYVKSQLLCSSAYSATDGSLDQETFYAYDANGRIVEEYVRDDSGRLADHKYSWTKNGALTQFITPSGATMSWAFGSTGNNSDTDLVTAITQSSTTILSSIAWFPFGSVASYKLSSTIGGLPLQTVISRNLAYRISDTQMNSSSTEYEGVNIGEDSKGRVVKRDYFNNSAGVQDSYFIYDEEDRVLCETTSFASTCPAPGTSFASVKNDRLTTPYFTNGGDWNDILRFDRGALNTDTFSLNSGTHQISQVAQGATLGNVVYTYNVVGDRTSDGGTGSDEVHTGRTYTYDGRHNLVNVRMQYIYCRCGFRGMAVWHYFDLGSAFDARGRRVSKTFYDETTGDTSTLFYYYDPADRLTEMKYTPHISSPSAYSVYQVAWLAGRQVMHTQTDYPSATVSRRYTVSDESNRTISMWSWPSTGDSSRVWAVNPNAWAYDVPPITGASILQPFGFAGQYVDWETYAVADGSTTIYQEPALSLNGARTYDPFTGAFLQLDPLVETTRSGYLYSSSDPVNESDVSGMAANECKDSYHEQDQFDDYGNVIDMSMTVTMCSSGPPDNSNMSWLNPHGNQPGNTNSNDYIDTPDHPVPAVKSVQVKNYCRLYNDSVAQCQYSCPKDTPEAEQTCVASTAAACDKKAVQIAADCGAKPFGREGWKQVMCFIEKGEFQQTCTQDSGQACRDGLIKGSVHCQARCAGACSKP